MSLRGLCVFRGKNDLILLKTFTAKTQITQRQTISNGTSVLFPCNSVLIRGKNVFIVCLFLAACISRFPAFAENDGRRGRRMTATRRAIVALAMRLVVTFAMLHLLRAFHVGVIDSCQILLPHFLMKRKL